MQARRLLVGRLLGSRGGEGVARACGRSEETEGVEVGAGDLVRLDDGVRALAAESQRPGRVAHVGRFEPVDHGPLVQPEAAETTWALGGAGEQLAHEPHRVAARFEEGVHVDMDAEIVGGVEAPVGLRDR